MIEIWNPKYSTDEVLIAKYKVSPGINRIKFTKAKALKGMIFEIEGSEIMKYPVKPNGKIPCYFVPMEKLKNVTRESDGDNQNI